MRRNRYLIFVILATLVFSTDFTFADSFTIDNLNLREAQPTTNFPEAYFKIGLEETWEQINNAPSLILFSVTMGMIDTGLDSTHPEFSQFPEVNLGNTPPDARVDIGDNGFSHGTNVAGIIGANNISATSSNNYQFPHMNGVVSGVKDLDYTLEVRRKPVGPFAIFSVAKKIFELSKNKTQIINLSFNVYNFIGTPIFSSSFFVHPDTLFVVAAGNNNRNTAVVTPANLGAATNVVTVGATTLSDDRLPNSNFGLAVGISAPGEKVFSPTFFTEPLNADDYEDFTDTSAATPLVTGIAGLLKAINPALTPLQIKQIITETADPIFTTDLNELGKTLGSACNDGSPGFRGCRLNAREAVCHPLALNCAATPPPPPVSPHWPFLQRDAQKTGLTGVSGPAFTDSSDVTIKWQKPFLSVGGVPPLIAEDGTIYIAGTGNTLHALSGETGDTIWTSTTTGGVSRTALGPDGTIYTCSNSQVSGRVSAFAPANGTLKWVFVLGDPRPCTHPVVDTDGTIYVSTPPPRNAQTGQVVALNPDGSEKWRHQEPSTTAATSPTLSHDEDQVYVAFSSRLLAFNTDDGSILWQQRPISTFFASLTVVVDALDNVYVSDFFNGILAFSKQGTPLWTSAQSFGGILGFPALTTTGDLVVAHNSLSIVRAEDGTTATTVPRTDTTSFISNALVDSDNVAYVASDLASNNVAGVEAIDLASGSSRWFFSTAPDDTNEFLSMGVDGTLYIVAPTTIYALGEL